MSVVPHNAPQHIRVRAQQAINVAQEGSRIFENFTTELVEGHRIDESIIETAKQHDLVVIGATEEPLFRNRLTGSVPARVAKNAGKTVIIVKRRSGVIRSMLRQTVISPSTGAASNGHTQPEAEALTDADSANPGT
jgi:hypothetical protein